MSEETKAPFDDVNDALAQLKAMHHYAKSIVETLSVLRLQFDGGQKKLRQGDLLETLMTHQRELQDSLNDEIAFEKLLATLQPPRGSLIDLPGNSQPGVRRGQCLETRFPNDMSVPGTAYITRLGIAVTLLITATVSPHRAAKVDVTKCLFVDISEVEELRYLSKQAGLTVSGAPHVGLLHPRESFNGSVLQPQRPLNQKRGDKEREA